MIVEFAQEVWKVHKKCGICTRFVEITTKSLEKAVSKPKTREKIKEINKEMNKKVNKEEQELEPGECKRIK